MKHLKTVIENVVTTTVFIQMDDGKVVIRKSRVVDGKPEKSYDGAIQKSSEAYYVVETSGAQGSPMASNFRNVKNTIEKLEKFVKKNNLKEKV